MAASDCSFCGKHGVPCVLRKGTAAICGACAAAIDGELGLSAHAAASTRARFETELARARVRARSRSDASSIPDARPAPASRPAARRSYDNDARPSVVVRRRATDAAPTAARAPGRRACSFCGGDDEPLVSGVERFRGETELVTVLGAPVLICTGCVERALAALRPS